MVAKYKYASVCSQRKLLFNWIIFDLEVAMFTGPKRQRTLKELGSHVIAAVKLGIADFI